MKRMSVLALSGNRNGLFSVQIEFSPRGTELHSAHTADEAAEFLRRHPGALILCDRLARANFASGPLAEAVEAGHPCAIVWMDDLGPQRFGVEIEECGGLAAARKILEDPSLLQKIHVAWRYCRQCCAQPDLAATEDCGRRPF